MKRHSHIWSVNYRTSGTGSVCPKGIDFDDTGGGKLLNL